MRIGIFGGAVNGGTIDDVVAEVRSAADDGFASYWSPQVFSHDAMTVLAIAGREVPGIELGTSVVPTYPRHPFVMAQQALSTQVATGGRFCLGIGLSHQVVIEGMWGLSFAKPVGHLRDYLAVLMPLLHGQPADVDGATISAHAGITLAGDVPPVPVVVAALGPQMLDLAGRVADGTLTWCVGPQTLASYTVPGITAAADKAGRPAPRVIAAFPVCVTDDKAAVASRATKAFSIYPQLPSYKAMLDREGVATVADLAITGGEAEVADRIAALADAGVTDLAAVEFARSGDERQRTREVLRGLCAP
jgi:F420-dependent oxidoreductase-like protein